MAEFIVYRHTNQINGKSYIGVTGQGLQARWWGHVSDARNKTGMCRLFHNALRKYGDACWFHETLFVTDDRSEALAKERELIASHGTNLKGRGYNISAGGDLGNYGLRYVCLAISNRQRGADNPCFGKVYTPEQRAERSLKMKAWHAANPGCRRGSKSSPETRLKQSVAHTGERNHFYGKKHTPEALKIMSEKNPWNGKWGWRNASSQSEVALAIYADADRYFAWWSALPNRNAKRGSGADTMARVFDMQRRKAHCTLITHFRDGWNPTEDTAWIEFKRGR